MGIEKTDIARFLQLAKHVPLIDVRSPGEYKHAHIPGAVNMPLFSDEERKIVGTAYKQESREKAIRLGLDFFGPKMNTMLEEAEKIIGNWQSPPGNSAIPDHGAVASKSNCLLIYCWRGGMRSAGVAWLMDLYGFKVYTLSGGYKKFRNHVLDTFRLPFRFKIIGGYTGSGKTEVLKMLRDKGETIVDLEAIAGHKGSAFGNIGLPVQPTQEMFENKLALQLRQYTGTTYLSQELVTSSQDIHKPVIQNPIWLEDESQRIGLVNIPADIWQNMRHSAIYFLQIPFEERLKHLVLEYGGLDKEKMIEAIGRIRERLGGLNAKNACLLLEEGQTAESFRILLAYYDKFYLKALHNRESLNSLLYTIECLSVTPENASHFVRQSQHLMQKSPSRPEKI